MRTIRSLALASLMLIGSVVAPAATPLTGAITPAATLVTWSGVFDAEHLLTPAPEVPCLLGECDTFTLTVALGEGFWGPSGGAVEVAIRFAYDGITDLDLLVSDSAGNEVGRSAAVDSNAESVFLPNLADGTYTVTVVPSNTINPDNFDLIYPAEVPYEGLAQVEPFAASGPGDDLLPNLVSLPPHNFHIASAANLVPFPENPILSCYPEETIESDAHPTRCLRFDQTIANTGAGPLELRFAMNGVASIDPADQRLVQRIYADDGSYRENLADSYEVHLAHGHVHYRGFGQSVLYAYDWAARARVEDPQGAPVVASVGNKVGFCVIDVKLLDAYWGATGNGARTRTFPTCNVPSEIDDDGTAWLVQGIDVGWADVYGWNLADQYIDITAVTDGIYELEQLANPNHSVLEQSTDDNTASTVICLKDETVFEVRVDADAVTCLS